MTFELSKVESLAIRERMVSHLLNIDETLATTVAQKLGFQSMPKPADAAMPTRQDLEASPALSIVERGPMRFEGRKLGIMIADGVDAKLLKALTKAVAAQKAVIELIAPKVGGVTADDGSSIEANHMIDGGPSVLFDAVVLLTSHQAIDDLVKEAAARDFVADAFQHCKYIGYDQSAMSARSVVRDHCATATRSAMTLARIARLENPRLRMSDLPKLLRPGLCGRGVSAAAGTESQ